MITKRSAWRAKRGAARRGSANQEAFYVWRTKKPTSIKATVLVAGTMMTSIGALLSFAVLFDERVPDAPLWAIVVAHVLALGGLAYGLYILINGIRMP